MIKASDKDAWYHRYRSRVVDNSRRHVVAIALSKVTQTAHLVWESISPRLAHARLKGVKLNTPVVIVHFSPEDDWREFKDGCRSAPDILRKTRRRRRDLFTSETIALVEETRLAPNHRGLLRPSTRSLRTDHNAYRETITEETLQPHLHPMQSHLHLSTLSNAENVSACCIWFVIVAPTLVLFSDSCRNNPEIFPLIFIV